MYHSKWTVAEKINGGCYKTQELSRRSTRKCTAGPRISVNDTYVSVPLRVVKINLFEAEPLLWATRRILSANIV